MRVSWAAHGDASDAPDTDDNSSCQSPGGKAIALGLAEKFTATHTVPLMNHSHSAAASHDTCSDSDCGGSRQLRRPIIFRYHSSRSWWTGTVSSSQSRRESAKVCGDCGFGTSCAQPKVSNSFLRPCSTILASSGSW